MPGMCLPLPRHVLLAMQSIADLCEPLWSIFLTITHIVYAYDLGVACLILPWPPLANLMEWHFDHSNCCLFYADISLDATQTPLFVRSMITRALRPSHLATLASSTNTFVCEKGFEAFTSCHFSMLWMQYKHLCL